MASEPLLAPNSPHMCKSCNRMYRCRDLASPEFQDWMKLNAAWLKPYAAFCFLRDMFGSADHRQWGLMHGNVQHYTEKLTAPDQPFHRDMCFTYWLQWHLHKQLLEAANYARAKRVVLKGDLPIGVAKSSADTWYSPHLFRMDVSVGSPPDAFDAKGQNWGFPGMHCICLMSSGNCMLHTPLKSVNRELVGTHTCIDIQTCRVEVYFVCACPIMSS